MGEIEQVESGEKLSVVIGDKIETDAIKAHHMDVGAGVLTVELPCGYLDAEQKLHDTITVGEMTGHDEDIIAGKGPVVPRLNQVILNCTKRLGEIDDRREINRGVVELTAADRMAALMAIRRVSLGDFYDVKIECPNKECKRQSRFSLNLADVDIIKMADPMVRSFEDELFSGRIVNWHILSANDEAWLTEKQKKKVDVITIGMLARIDSITDMDGNPMVLERVSKKGYRIALNIVKSLGIRERGEIRKLFEKKEGSVDTDVEFTCPECRHEWAADLDMGQLGFFFPSDT